MANPVSRLIAPLLAPLLAIALAGCQTDGTPPATTVAETGRLPTRTTREVLTPLDQYGPDPAGRGRRR